MLECRQDGPLLVVEIVPEHGAGRLARALVRVAALGSGPRRSGTRRSGIWGYRGGSIAAGTYLLAVAVAAAAGAGARLTPRPLIAGIIAAVVIGAGAHLIALASRRYLAARRITLTHSESGRVLDAAGRLAGRALSAASRLPEVSPLLGADEVRATLERALWDLGRLLRSYELCRERLAAAVRAGRSLPIGNTYLRREFERDRHAAMAQVRQREFQIARRLAGLRRLAEAYDEFRRRRRASDPTGDPKAVEDLAAHAESVLGAYRELLPQPSGDERFTRAG